MKNINKNKIYSILKTIILLLIVASMVLVPVLSAFAAENKRILTLGANMTLEQKQLIINYLNVDENEVEIITVTNEDEHKYLEGIASPQQIGSRTFSCAYIEPTTSGGIHIKTVNINWADSEMIRNALITSGIENCNIICVSPIEVSGTGSLTGIFKAYEYIGNMELDDEKIELASEELITTMDLAKDIGKETATSLISKLKELVIVNELETEAEISGTIDEYLKEHNLELTEDQKWAIIGLLIKISGKDYDVNKIRAAYTDIKQAIEIGREVYVEAKPFLDKAWDWTVETWYKVSGKYEEFKQSEEYIEIQNQLGILAETKDELLGENTVVTGTDSTIIEEVEQKIEETIKTSDDGDWLDNLIRKALNRETAIYDEIDEPEEEEIVEVKIPVGERFKNWWNGMDAKFENFINSLRITNTTNADDNTVDMLNQLKDTSIVDVEITFDTFNTEDYDIDILDNITDEQTETVTESEQNQENNNSGTVQTLDDLISE